MCGIAGYFGLTLAAPEREPLLRRMCDAIRHRGPDDEGYFADERVGLGIRRLSIIDLDGGHQPMSTPDGRYHVIFNGEIYNYHALRAQMEKQGEGFATKSDTEVLVRQIARDGRRGIHAFNGMFAFAVWKEADGELLLARDRMGVKPLYYCWDGERLLFASEIKALLASGLVAREVEPRAVWDYLTLRYVPAPHTVWKNVRKLPPGHFLTISIARPEPRVERYWDVPYRATPDHDDAGYDTEFAELFQDAVRLRMIADVPVGIMLSGGLDSSAVASVAVKLAGPTHRLNTFSVGFADAPEANELAYARMVADHLDTVHHDIVIGEREFLDFLPEFVRWTDEPLADLASVPLYYVSRLAREAVKVVLSGEGGDEILGGYDFELRAPGWDNRPRFVDWLVRRAPRGLVCALVNGDRTFDYRLHVVPPNMTNYMSAAAKRELLGSDAAFPDSLDEVREALERIGHLPPLDQWLYAFCQSWLVEDLLMKADKMSMANSIELRTPFLDYRLVEWAAQVPTRVKVGPVESGAYRSKRVLRRFARDRLPQEILERPKEGFPVPVYGWLNGRLSGWASDVLGSQSGLAGRMDPVVLKRYVAAGTAAGAGILDRHRLWNLIVLELWCREWRV